MALPSLRSSAKSNDAGAGTQIAVLLPPTIASGDDLIIGIMWEGNGDPNTPSGWTLIGSCKVTNAGQHRAHFFRKTGGAVGDEDGTSVTVTGLASGYGF